ncbi:hypothetical protein V6N13_089504 [Hibiscus sabdariffa]|uniref:Uncharacterized protein n=1 Tax=Hibiscus sabdariffa TaxID=183260 RepID=A0ABR2QJP0_9ROSI
MEKMPVTRQNSEEIDKFLDGAASFADMMFGFLDGSSEPEENSGDLVDRDENVDHNEVEQNKIFWEAQQQLLQATLRRTTCLESRIRQATKEALSEIEQCGCRAGGCRNCLQRELSVRLRKSGFDCYTCKSKWRSSPEIPSGEHSYLEVLDKSSNPKKGEVRVVIELNFRAEFEMARASEDYNKLIAAGALGRENGEGTRTDQDLMRRCQKMHEGEENALGSVEKAEVHASQVAWNIRENDGGGAFAGGTFGATPTETKGIHANL